MEDRWRLRATCGLRRPEEEVGDKVSRSTPPVGKNLEQLPRGPLNGFELPVLCFEDQQAATWVKNDEVGVRLLGANGYVVPEQIVAIKFLLKPLC